MKSFPTRSAVTSLVLLAAFAGSPPAFAQFQKAEDAVKYRKASFTLIGAHIGRINGQLKSDKPDLQAIQASAALLATFDDLPWEAFGKDTALPDSKAKAEIWTEADKFKGASEKMMAAVDKLNVAAKSGDLGAIRTAFGNTGETCKGCHDAFRAK